MKQVAVVSAWDRESRGRKHSQRLMSMLLFSTVEKQPVCPRGKPCDKGSDGQQLQTVAESLLFGETFSVSGCFFMENKASLTG